MSKVQIATKPFKAKMKKVIKAEARAKTLIDGYLIAKPGHDYAPVLCKSVGHCALGALMFAAGVSDKKIQEFQEDNTNYYHGVIPQILFDAYHIDGYDADDIISANDTTDGSTQDVINDRLEMVLAEIDELPIRRRERPEL